MRLKSPRSFGKKTAAAFVSVTLLFAACGGDDDSDDNSSSNNSSSSSSSSSSGSSNADMIMNEMEENTLDLFQCLRDQGIDIKDPSFEGNGLQESMNELSQMPGAEQAAEACTEEAEKMLDVFGGPEKAEEFVEDYAQFARCMREHGYNIPDPDPNNPETLQPNNIDFSDATIEATAKDCLDESNLQIPG